MKTNVFWSVVGGLVLLWIILIVLVVLPKKESYEKTANDLQSSVRTLEQMARMEPAKIPSEALKENREQYFERYSSNYQEAFEFYEERDRRFEDLEGRTSPTDWYAAYNDAYEKLGARYRAHANLPEDKPLPFKRAEDPRTADRLGLTQKRWRIQRTLVEEIMSLGGTIEEYSPKEVRERLEHFETLRSTVKLALPPTKLRALINSLLEHDTINFEIQELQVGKQRDALIIDLVKEAPASEPQPISEPHVLCRMVIDVLDWDPPAPEVAEEN